MEEGEGPFAPLGACGPQRKHENGGSFREEEDPFFSPAQTAFLGCRTVHSVQWCLYKNPEGPARKEEEESLEENEHLRRSFVPSSNRSVRRRRRRRPPVPSRRRREGRKKEASVRDCVWRSPLARSLAPPKKCLDAEGNFIDAGED